MDILRIEVVEVRKVVGDQSNFPETGVHISIIWEKVTMEDLNSCTVA